VNFSKQMGETQAAAGLPPEPLRDIAISCDSTGQRFALSCSVQRYGVRIARLFVRTASDDKYEPVSDYLEPWLQGRQTGISSQSTEISMRSPIFGTASRLFFVIDEVTNTRTGVVGGNTLGIACFSVGKRTVEVWDTRLPADTACEVTRLIGSDVASGALYAIAGFPAVAADNTGYRIVYAVARLDFDKRSAERITDLKNVFY
jgi:hypothetical protein